MATRQPGGDLGVIQNVFTSDTIASVNFRGMHCGVKMYLYIAFHVNAADSGYGRRSRGCFSRTCQVGKYCRMIGQ